MISKHFQMEKADVMYVAITCVGNVSEIVHIVQMPYAKVVVSIIIGVMNVHIMQKDVLRGRC